MDNLFENQPGTANLFTTPVHRNQSEAILYLFSPRRMSDHYKRPVIYNFNTPFIEELYTTIATSLQQGDYNIPGSNFNPNLDRLYSNPHAAGVIMPAYTGGIELNTSILSNNWTFMLLVNNDKPELGSSIFTTHNMSRTIYYGICLDEPVNPVNHGHELTPNPNCFMTITHATAINSLPTIGPRAIGSTRYDTVSDIDIVPGQTMSMLTPIPLIMNRPDDIRKMSITDSSTGETITAITNADEIGNSPKHIPVSATLNSPRKHSRKILSAILTGYEAVTDDNYSGAYSKFPGAINGYDDVSTQISANLWDTTNEQFLGLNVDKPIALSVIMRRYSPKILPIYITQNLTHSIIPQQYQCAVNVYSSMIASAAPSILSNAGIANFACSYNSYYNAFQVRDAATFVVMNPQELQARVRTVYRLLQSELFDLIKATAGHFDVNMSISCGGDTNIIFNLLDVNSENTDTYEHHNLLGGMTNQLVANTNIIQNNTTALGNLLGTLQATI